MRIKKFNEDIDFSKIGESLFNNYDILQDVLLPLKKYGNHGISYQLFIDHEDFPMVIGNDSIKNFKDKLWEVICSNHGYNIDGNNFYFGDKLLTLGCKINIRADVLNVLTREHQRTGKYFSTFDYNLQNIISDIMEIKQVVEDDGYTLAISIVSDRIENNISLLILSEKYN